MKMRILLLVFFIAAIVSCSKSKETAEIPPAKDNSTVPTDNSVIADKSKEYQEALIGTWKLVKQNSDMGPILWPSYYRRTLTFDSTFSYTDSILFQDYPKNNQIATFKYKVEVKERTSPGYNPYIFLNFDDTNIISRSGIFKGVKNDTLFIFNGVGAEYYTKLF